MSNQKATVLGKHSNQWQVLANCKDKQGLHKYVYNMYCISEPDFKTCPRNGPDDSKRHRQPMPLHTDTKSAVWIRRQNSQSLIYILLCVEEIDLVSCGLTQEQCRLSRNVHVGQSHHQGSDRR